MTCGECGRFPVCFAESNELLDISPDEITEHMVDEAMSVPACEHFKARA